MIKKFLSKYILEVIPSIVATVVGAYIVTHYINARPDADKPKTAISAPAADGSVQETPKAEAARLKAEKLAAEKAAAERAAVDRAENAKRAAINLPPKRPLLRRLRPTSSPARRLPPTSGNANAPSRKPRP